MLPPDLPIRCIELGRVPGISFENRRRNSTVRDPGTAVAFRVAITPWRVKYPGDGVARAGS
jgi:hypothetical protein